MPRSKEKIRAHGQILVDFANAEKTDEACFEYFNNIQTFLDFSAKFDEQVKKNFPSISSFTESMNETEIELMELIIEEKIKISSLNSQFEMIGYILAGCDSQNQKLLLSNYYQEGGLANGEPDFTTTVDGPYPYSVEEMKDEIEGSLHPDVSKHINELMNVGQSIYNLKSKIPKNRFKEIYDLSERYRKILNLHEQIREIQTDYRYILERIIEGIPLNEISVLNGKFMTIHGNSKKTTTKTIIEKDSIEEISRINEDRYIKIKSTDMWRIVLEYDLVFWMVEFFRDKNSRKYIRKCNECDKFYISRTLAPSKYCSDKCRLAYNNRKRIKSGEAKEYKRKKRLEGAKESYYG